MNAGTDLVFGHSSEKTRLCLVLVAIPQTRGVFDCLFPDREQSLLMPVQPDGLSNEPFRWVPE